MQTVEDDRGGQPRPGRADRRLRRPLRRRRPVRGRPGAAARSSARGRADRLPGRPPMRTGSSCCRSLAFVALAAGLLVVLRAGRPDRGQDPRGRGLPHRRPRPGRADRHVARRAAGRIDASAASSSARDTIGDTLEAATDAVERYAEEARALHGPARDADPRRPRRRARAGRPGARMVEHGDHDPRLRCAAARASSRPRPRSSAATSTCSTPARRSSATRAAGRGSSTQRPTARRPAVVADRA